MLLQMVALESNLAASREEVTQLREEASDSKDMVERQQQQVAQYQVDIASACVGAYCCAVL